MQLNQFKKILCTPHSERFMNRFKSTSSVLTNNVFGHHLRNGNNVSAKRTVLQSSVYNVERKRSISISTQVGRLFSSGPQAQTGTHKVLELVQRYLSRYSASTIMSPHCKEFAFDEYDVIGFDLDGTLLRYNLNTMVPLEYEIIHRFLVERKGYPIALLEQQFDCNFLQKGLVLDAENGNILKLSGNGSIMRATHGTTLLTTEQIVQTYGEDRKWSVSTQFLQDPLSTWNGPLAQQMRTLLDYFDFAVALVFGQVVNVLDAEALARGEARPSPYKVWPDILDALMEMYSRENFSNDRSAYFKALRSDPDRYLLRTNEKVIKFLVRLRESGKAIYLLTGSNIDFANFTASYAMGHDWQQLFDCVICFGKKPGFFSLNRPFLAVDGLAEVTGSELPLSEKLVLDSTYSQGNWSQLRSALAARVGKDPDQVRSLYVGDNLIQDVYSPVKHHDLDAIALCEELLADEGMSNGGDCAYEFSKVIASSFWGSYFSLDDEPTLWATIIARYSQLCIPLIDSVAEKSTSHKFFCENPNGYYPNAPT